MEKIIIMCTGPVRPNYERVHTNIVNSLKTLDNYSVEFNILSYETEASVKLKDLLEKTNPEINLYLIPFISENIGAWNGNSYRMFKTNKLLIQKVNNINNSHYVIRQRVDCELNHIEIPARAEANTWYAPIMAWGVPFDNLGLASPEVFERIFNLDDELIKDIVTRCETPHHALAAAAEHTGVSFIKVTHQVSWGSLNGQKQIGYLNIKIAGYE